MRLNEEQLHHTLIVNWFHTKYPSLADDFHHFANERKCSYQQGALLKRMGVKRGVADFFLAYPNKGTAGLWIELKVGKNKPTPEQVDFLKRKASRGYAAACVWGKEAVKAIIRDYLDDIVIEEDLVLFSDKYNDIYAKKAAEPSLPTRDPYFQ